MEELPAKGIKYCDELHKRTEKVLKNKTSSHISSRKNGSKWYNSTKYVTEKNLYNICKIDTDNYKIRIKMKLWQGGNL